MLTRKRLFDFARDQHRGPVDGSRWRTQRWQIIFQEDPRCVIVDL